MFDFINVLHCETEILNNELKPSILESVRSSFTIKYAGYIYIISAAHNISENSQIKLKNQNLNIISKIIIPEIDLIVIQVDNENFCEYENISHFDYDNFDNSYYYNQKSISKIEFLCADISKYNNNCLPDMLKLIFKYEDQNLEGYSGSPIFNGNQIVGLISGHDENYIQVIPFIFVKRVLNEIYNYKKFSGLCGFFYKLNVTRTSTIVSKQILSHSYYSQNYDSLKVNDILYKIDDMLITNEQVYFEELKSSISIQHYILLTKTVNDVISLKVLRDNNMIDVILGCRDLNSGLMFNIKSCNYDYIFENGNYFMPINYKTYEFISYFRNISQDKKLNNIFKNKILNKNSNKNILIFDLDNKINILNTKNDDYLVLDF